MTKTEQTRLTSWRFKVLQCAGIYKIIYSIFKPDILNARNSLKILARPAGLEPATPGLEGRCSIH